MDNGDLAGELGQVHSLFNSGVAAADHVHLEVLKERGVTGGAEGNALTDKLALVLAADGLGESASSQDNGLGQVLALGADQLLDFALQLNALDHVRDTLSAELFGLLGHTGDQAGAALAFDHLAGIVFDFISDGDLAAVLALLDDQGGQTGTAGIQTGSEAGRAGAQNDDIINFAHVDRSPA